MRKGQWKDGKPRPEVVNYCCQECRVKEERIAHLKTAFRAFVVAVGHADNATKSDVDLFLNRINAI